MWEDMDGWGSFGPPFCASSDIFDLSLGKSSFFITEKHGVEREGSETGKQPPTDLGGYKGGIKIAVGQ